MDTKSLHRIAYNVALYAAKDATAHGHTLWTRRDGHVSATACDDYFALTDGVRTARSPNWQRVMAPEALRELELMLRSASVDMTHEVAILDASTSDVDFEDEVILSALVQAEELCFPEAAYAQPAYPSTLDCLALSPDRMRKLSLIKPGGYPIDMMVMKWLSAPGGRFIAFRCGPTVRGAIAVLDREELGKLYKGEEIWH